MASIREIINDPTYINYYLQREWDLQPLLKRTFVCLIKSPPQLLDNVAEDFLERTFPLVCDDVNLQDVGSIKISTISDTAPISTMPSFQQASTISVTMTPVVNYNSPTAGYHTFYNIINTWIAHMGFLGLSVIGNVTEGRPEHIDKILDNAGSKTPVTDLYKGNMLVMLFDATDYLYIREAYLCLGVFPLSINNVGNFSRNAMEFLTYQISFNVDFIMTGPEIVEGAANELREYLMNIGDRLAM